MIELINVSKKFGKKIVLNNVNLNIADNEIVGILGANGSGKSVFLKIISGFIKPDKGKVNVSGAIGISIQDNSFYESLTVKQNLKYFANIYGVKEKKEIIKYLTGRLGLDNFLNANAGTLSGGTKKKLDLACSLLNSPHILILDEPFTGLDKKFVMELAYFLRQLNKSGIGLIISSHNFSQISEVCNRFLMVDKTSVTEVSKSQAIEMF